MASRTVRFAEKGDVALVTRIYMRSFMEDMGGATAFHFKEQGWGDAELTTLSASLS